jgi:asparagine synthase (glutamine-hydrolysing)
MGLLEALAEDAGTKHLPTLLRYGDRNSMAHSREVRLPFCDHRIAEFVFSLDPVLLMGNGETKRLLREATRGLLPEQVRCRWRKQGFLPPQEAWFQQGLAEHAGELFADSRFAARGMWNVPWWQQALDRFKRGETHLAWSLWKPMIAEAWHEHFVDRARAAPKMSALAP